MAQTFDIPIRVPNRAFSGNADLRAELLARFPDTRFTDAVDRLKGDALVEFLDGAEGAVVGLELITEELLARLPALRMVSKFGVGLDNVDHRACARHQVDIGWTAGVNRISVAELTLAFMLGLSHRVFTTSRRLAGGTWKTDGGAQLTGKTVGIVGVGHIGKEVVRLLQPFDCRILVNDIVDIGDYCATTGVTEVDKPTLFREADIVTLHTPLTDETDNMIDGSALAGFRPGAMLINTARGGLIDEAALKAALVGGALGAAALDVFAIEPPTDQELLALPNLAATPHVGGNAVEAVLAMGRSAISHLVARFECG